MISFIPSKTLANCKHTDSFLLTFLLHHGICRLAKDVANRHGQMFAPDLLLAFLPSTSSSFPTLPTSPSNLQAPTPLSPMQNGFHQCFWPLPWPGSSTQLLITCERCSIAVPPLKQRSSKPSFGKWWQNSKIQLDFNAHKRYLKNMILIGRRHHHPPSPQNSSSSSSVAKRMGATPIELQMLPQQLSLEQEWRCHLLWVKFSAPLQGR